MARLSVQLMGTFQVALDGGPVAGFVSDKVRALLAYLAVEGTQPQRREFLAGLLWGGYPERSARASLRNALVNLRHVIGDREAQPPYLHITPQAIQLHPEGDVWVDVAAFAQLVDGTGNPQTHREQQPDRLEAAVALYQGSFLEGFSLADSPAFEEWALLVRERLQRQMLTALQALVEHYERHGDLKRALTYARRVVELEPYPEAAQRQLMRLLAANGQRELALALYERYCRLLSEDLGVAPGQETVRLYERIRDGQDLTGLGYLSGLRVPPHNLLAQSTPFVGRENELGELERLLAEPEVRLVTVVGPGGIGKTRLALQCASEVVAGAGGDGFPDGIYFVPLVSARTVDAVVSTMGHAIGFSFPGGGDPRARLLRYLRGKRMLLVLDNVEQLVASSGENGGGDQPKEGAAFLLELLRVAPGVKLLVTSRVRLNASGEHVLAVPGMEYPPQDMTGCRWESGGKPVRSVLEYSGVQLYLQQARRVRSGYEPGDEVLAQIGRICRMAEGMPLAIVLAAAWMDILSPGEIALDLERSITFLRGELRDLPERHHSMVAAFDVSWRMLSEAERDTFATLSVFRGGCTREAAEAVAGADLEVLRALARKSFLTRDANGRYQVHELLRQYGEEKLRERPENWECALGRHSSHYLAVLERWAEELGGPRLVQVSREMALESGNVNAAWSWAVGKGCWRDVGRAAVGLRRLYVIGWGFREGRAAFEGAATRLRDIYGARPILTATQGYTRNAGKEPMLSASEATRVLLWLILSQFPFAQDAETWQQLFQQCEALLSDLELAGEDTRSEQADLAHHAASPTVWVVTMQEAREYARRALALDRELGNRRSMALTYGILGLQSYLLCDYEEARKYLEQELELACSLGDPRVSMDAMLWLTRSAICQGQVAEVEHWLSRLRPMVTGWGNRFEDDPLGLWLWGEAHLLSGRYVEASAALHECATRYRESEGRVYLGRMLPLLGMAYAHLGRYGQARVVAEEAVALNRETLSSGCVGSALCVLGDVALAEGQDKGAMALFEEAAGISRAGADRKRLAEALAHLAYGAWCLGREREARQNLAKAIRLGREVCSPLPLWAVLPACALLLAERGEPERAAELYAQAWSVPHIAHSHWYEDVAGHELAAVVADLPPVVRKAALGRGRAQELWDMAETLLAELEKKGA